MIISFDIYIYSDNFIWYIYYIYMILYDSYDTMWYYMILYDNL